MLKSSQGSALLTVLLITTLFTIMGLSLLAINLNHMDQTEKKLHQTQAINAAEMGLKAYNKMIDEIIKNPVPPKTIAEFKEKLKTLVPPPLPETASKKNIHYSIVESAIDDVDSNDNRLIWTIRSVGTANNVNYPITIQRTFTFHGDGTGSDAGLTPPFFGYSIYSGGTITLQNVDGDIDNVLEGPPINLDMLEGQFNQIDNLETLSGESIDPKNNPVYQNSVGITGDLNLPGLDDKKNKKDDSVTFLSNVLIDGDLTIYGKGTFEFDGYLLVKGKITIIGSGKIIFKKAVYARDSVYVESTPSNGVNNALEVFFEDGLASNSDVTLTAEDKSRISITVKTQQIGSPANGGSGDSGIDSSIGNVNYGS